MVPHHNTSQNCAIAVTTLGSVLPHRVTLLYVGDKATCHEQGVFGSWAAGVERPASRHEAD